MNGKFLKYIIADRNSTVNEAAKIVGCTPSTFSKRMSDEVKESSFSIVNCEKLAEFYKMTDREVLKAFFNRE